MKIQKIYLKNYRNIDNESIEFNPNINIFIGDNAQGKTNILESIYTLALSKSHRSIYDIDIIQKDKDFTKIVGNINYQNKKSIQEIIISKMGKILKINNNNYHKVSDYVSKMNVIMFTPDDLDIIKKSPQTRRNLLNTELCQLDSNYTILLNEYNKILRMRNEYLKNYENKNNDIYLDILTEKLIDRAINIYEYRDNFINAINNKISNIFYKITKTEGLKVKYEKSLNTLNRDELVNYYHKNIMKEKLQRMTLYGPHRDDFSFYIGDEDIKLFGSQGQQRVAVLSFKIAEIDIFKAIKKEYPIVLLDDVFSELDIKKRNNFIKFVKSNIQYIITTTDLANISDKLLENSAIFYIKRGKIQRKKVGKDGKAS